MSTSETAAIEIVVNGERRTAPAGLDLAGLLAHLNIDNSRVAVELNREIVRKPDWNRTTIRSGDRLEIVQFVGGG
jgi:sulfur carrier protein